MDTKRIHFSSPHECKYRYNGKNIWELRRAKLRLIAIAIGAQSEGEKHIILGSVINKLDNMGAETEISEIGKKKEKAEPQEDE